MQALERIAEVLAQEPERASPGPASKRPLTSRTRRQIMALNFIKTELREKGPLTWPELWKRGAEFKHSEVTMRRVRDKVAVNEYRDGRWIWRLREDA